MSEKEKFLDKVTALLNEHPRLDLYRITVIDSEGVLDYRSAFDLLDENKKIINEVLDIIHDEFCGSRCHPIHLELFEKARKVVG